MSAITDAGTLQDTARVHLWMSYRPADGLVSGEDAPTIVESNRGIT